MCKIVANQTQTRQDVWADAGAGGSSARCVEWSETCRLSMTNKLNKGRPLELDQIEGSSSAAPLV